MSPNHCRPGRRAATAVLACSVAAGLPAWLGCTEQAFLNATRPLGLDVFLNASDVRSTGGLVRGQLGVGFINRTHYRAIGTFGGYDPQDKQTVVTLGQLGVDLAYNLEPNAVAPVFGIPATRAFSIGSRRHLDLIFDNDLDSTATFLFAYTTGFSLGTFLPSTDLLKEGLGFTGASFDAPLGSVPTQGTAQPITLYIGTDYLFDSIVIFELYEDQSVQGGFRIDNTTAKALGVDTERLVQLVPSDRAIELAPLTTPDLAVDPNGLDVRRFNLLAALGAPTDEGPTFTLDSGPNPDLATISFSNQTGLELTLALFGPEVQVVPYANGVEKTFTVLPGRYEYLIVPSSLAGPVSLNAAFFDAGSLHTMALQSAGG